MATPLLTVDARELRRLARPRWLRLTLAWTVAGAAGVVSGLHIPYVQHCSDLHPCQLDVPGATAVGLLFGCAVAVFLQPALTVALAAGFVVASTLSALSLAQVVPTPLWLYPVDFAFLLLCLLVAAALAWRHAAARQWLDQASREVVPAPAAEPARPGWGWRGFGVALLAAAIGATAWGWSAQARVARQVQAAQLVTTEVVAKVDDFAIRVKLPSGELIEIGVWDAADHPVGQKMDLYVDGAGLRQPVSEPYDATTWLALALILGSAGSASWLRGSERSNRLRELLTLAQPVTQVYVRPGYDMVAVYPGDAQPGEQAVAEIAHSSRLLIQSGHEEPDDYPDDVIALRSTRPAVLYGLAVPGQWCAVAFDGITVIPTRTLRRRVTAPPFSMPTVDGSPDLVRLGPPSQTLVSPPLRTEDVEALAPADKDYNPYQVHQHVPHPLVGYFTVVGAPLVLFAVVPYLPSISYAWMSLICAGVVGLSCLVGRVLVGRPQVTWNGGGLAATGYGGTLRLAWPEVAAITAGSRDVTITTDRGEVTVDAGRLRRLVGGGWRSADQLAAALRLARQRALADPVRAEVEPPGYVAVGRASVLVLLWLAWTPLLAWLLTYLS